MKLSSDGQIEANIRLRITQANNKIHLHTYESTKQSTTQEMVETRSMSGIAKSPDKSVTNLRSHTIAHSCVVAID